MVGPSRRQPGACAVHRRARAAGLSLQEVLVVIGIIVLLLAMLFPSLQYARTQSQRMTCKNNLGQWSFALHCYLNDHRDYLPAEGTYLNLNKPYSWFNVLPPYLGAPAYKDVERKGKLITDFPELHVWICPAKLRSDANKSRSEKNQFHYGVNDVLDGMGSGPQGSKETPGFPDMGDKPIPLERFGKHPKTVYMFDIYPNSPSGFQRDVATRFHLDHANVLTLDGSVNGHAAKDFVTGGDFKNGDVVWDHPELYWGYEPPSP